MSSSKHLAIKSSTIYDWNHRIKQSNQQITSLTQARSLNSPVTSISAVYWPCKADPECNSVVPRTFCNDEGYCECPAGHVFSQDVSVCLTESLHGESCQEGVQCSHMLTGAVCSSNQCTCRQGLTYLQGRCRTLAPLHSECQVVSERGSYSANVFH